MKLLLVNPQEPTIYCGAPPLNILMLAGYVMKFGHNVKIVDCVVKDDFEESLELMKPDFVGITGTSITKDKAYQLADHARAKGFKVIIGGIHATIFPEEASKHADFVVKGEGEIVLKEILEGLSEGIITGVPLEDLNDIPILPYHLINLEYYLTFTPRIFALIPPEFRAASLVTSKGCTHNCSFCHNSFRGLKYRAMSPKHICDELEFLIRNYQINAVFFIEDNMLQDNKRVKELCFMMEDRGIKLVWGCNARVDNLDRETLKIARAHGMIQITFGWESGSQKMLDTYLKGVTVKQNEDSIKICNECDIYPNGTIMIGGPKENMDDIKQTLNFIVRNKIKGGAGVCVTTPLPGTKLWKDAEKIGIIPENFDYKKLDFNNCLINMSEIDSQRVVDIVQKLRIINQHLINIYENTEAIEYIVPSL